MLEVQTRFQKDVSLRKPYCFGAYNKVRGKKQWIRISEGCPHNDPFCYEPTETKWFGVPEIVRNDVGIMDMNFLCKPQALETILALGLIEVSGKVVHYECLCGVDHRFLTQEIADALYKSRFRRMRIAWDWYYCDQFQIKEAIEKLLKAGYQRKDIMVFMICNWRITYDENLKKLDLCKVWNVKVCDCYFDGQVSPRIIPIFWISKQIEDFRKRVRKHNHLVNFGIDPEMRQYRLKTEMKQ